MSTTDPKAISLALAAPFPPEFIHWKPLTAKGDRALACAFVDARAVMMRLDNVLGLDGWADSYQFLDGGSVLCTLSIRINGEWISKSDVGSPSEQPDESDRVKAAVSDGLKRAAVKVGVARYLYRLPRIWADYDPQKRQFKQTPQLPAWALPPAKQSA